MATKALKIEAKLAISLMWKHKELFFWIVALVLLYFADLHFDFTLCIPSNLGVKSCSGCGLGHAITEAMHGNFTSSWQYHKLGMPALIILLVHVAKLTRNLVRTLK